MSQASLAPVPAPANPEEPAPDPVALDREWLATVYAGDDQPQLTLRAVVMGTLLGAVLAFSNVYVGLKVGFSLGVALTACVVSYALFRVVPLGWMQAPRTLKIFDRHRTGQVSLLESNCLQSTASAAGFSTGATLVSAFPAYVMLTGQSLSPWAVGSLVFFLAALGVFLAIPMKRSMINLERLPFPSGTAAAQTLRSLHAEGAGSSSTARCLFTAAGLGALLAWLRDGQSALATRWESLGFLGRLALPDFVPLSELGRKLGLARLALIADPAGYTLSLQTSPLLAAAGALMGMRVASSMLLGALLDYGLLAPWLFDQGIIAKLGFRGIVGWSVWSGVSILTSAALLSFFWEWRLIARAVTMFTTSLRGRTADLDPLAGIEVPGAWFAVGAGIATLGCVVTNRLVFGIPVLLGLLAVGLSGLLAIVACRATGETDAAPVGPLGKLTQLLYGVLLPQSSATNLMTANVTAAVAVSSADLLTDLKAGYLLGANPRKQFLAQLFGVVGGSVAATAGFFLLVPDPSALGGNEFPAPAAQVWKAVAELFAKGLAALPPLALQSIAAGLAIGVGLTLLEKLLPRGRRWLPSPVGLGMAFTFPGYCAISFFLGALAARLYRAARPEAAERYSIPTASGLIAGESLAGVLIALLRSAHLL